MDGIWFSPANVAMVSAKLARQLGGAAPDQAYLLGLFHDVGKVLMLRKHKDYLDAFDQANQEGVSIVTVEDSRYNTNHAVLGYLVSRSWSVPKDISQLILHHHNVNELLENGHAANSTNLNLLAIFAIAELTDHRFLGGPHKLEWELHGNSVLTYLGIDEWELEDLVEDMTEMLMAQHSE